MSQKGIEKELPPVGHRKRPLSIIEEHDDDGIDTGGQETPEKENLPANEVLEAETVRSPAFKAIKQFFIDKTEGHKKNVPEDKGLGQKKVENKKKPVSESLSHGKVTKSKPSDTKPAHSTPATTSSKHSMLIKTSRIAPKIQSVIKSATTKTRESCHSPTPTSKSASKPKTSSTSSSSSLSRDQNTQHSTSSGPVDKHGKTSSAQPKLTKLNGVHKVTKKTATKHENSTKEIKSSISEISEKEKTVGESSHDSPVSGLSGHQNSSGIVGESVPSTPDGHILSSQTHDAIADGQVPLTSCVSENTSGQIDDLTTDESSTDTPKIEISKIELETSSQPVEESEVITEKLFSVTIQILPIPSSSDTFCNETSSKSSENDQNSNSQTPEVSNKSSHQNSNSQTPEVSNKSSHQNSLESQAQQQQTSLQSSSISISQQPTSDAAPEISAAATSECKLSLQPSSLLPENPATSQNSVESDSPNFREIRENLQTTINQRRDSGNRLQIPLPLTLSTSPPSTSLLLLSPTSLSPAIQLHSALSPKLYTKFRASPTLSRKYSIERNPIISSVNGKLTSISPHPVSPPRDISKECSPTDDSKEFGFALDKFRLTGRPVVPGSPILGSRYRPARRGSYFFKRKQSTDSLNSLSENEMLENGDDVSPLSAADLNRLKETAERMHLSTRRPSVLNWRQNYLHDGGLRKVAPDLSNGDSTDESLTSERKQRINEALEWLRNELQDMRTQDQALARQLLAIRQDINQLKLQRCTEEHQNLLDDFKSELEELQEFSDVLDLPHPIYEDNPLKHIGITRHNMSARRFSAC